ncbi:hypothetical protein B0J18DRAFT_85155 [Chaetomium sp. MPI-SDFR-AT-0129]|nr:hypothetical protein B0J18DRAFT_85155 [Chaetomium sp. MPI-SDFR-AT-0129]
MAPLRSLLAAGLFLFSSVNAHFSLDTPKPLEGDNMNEELEPNAPCGGGVPDLSKNDLTDFHVGGDSVHWQLGHPQANFLVRATLDSKAEGKWTQLFPIVQQSFRGDFCEPVVTAPKEWAGKKGFISIACAAPDGFLFQCAAVNFVSGSADAPKSCTNGTQVTGSFVNDASLTALLDGESGTTTSPSPSQSTSTGAASALYIPSGSLPLGSLAVTAAMVVLGAALL